MLPITVVNDWSVRSLPPGRALHRPSACRHMAVGELRWVPYSLNWVVDSGGTPGPFGRVGRILSQPRAENLDEVGGSAGVSPCTAPPRGAPGAPARHSRVGARTRSWQSFPPPLSDLSVGVPSLANVSSELGCSLGTVPRLRCPPRRRGEAWERIAPGIIVIRVGGTTTPRRDLSPEGMRSRCGPIILP